MALRFSRRRRLVLAHAKQLPHSLQYVKKEARIFHYHEAVSWELSRPFNDLPRLPPAAELETIPVLKAVTSARVELARLEQATHLMVDPHVLLNTIPLLEAQASSEIENIVTTADALFQQAQLNESSANPEVKETLRYQAALWLGLHKMRSRALSAQVAVDVCSQIKGQPMEIRAVPGVRIADAGTGDVRYSPPEGPDLIRGLLSDWERYIHSDDDVDPVVRMAVAHYQFEAIHPFTDGNGRTGRILNILQLVSEGLLTEPVLYLSRSIIDSKADYYRLLRAVTAESAWEEWVLYMIEAVREAAAATTRTIAEIQRVRGDFVAQHRQNSPGIANADFQALLFAQPYTRIGTVMQTCGVSRPTATNWLNSLVDAGAMETLKIGRDRLYLNQAFLSTLIGR